MTEFPKNPQRLTPYPNFRFKVKMQGRTVAGAAKVSGLQRSTTPIKFRSGGDPSTVHLAPGQTVYAPLTLERGVSYDPAFCAWANKVFDYSNTTTDASAAPSLSDFRQNLTIEVFNETGQNVLRYEVFNAWVSDFNALNDLDGNGDSTFVIQSMTLQNEGFTTTSVTAAPPPPFDSPAF